MKQLKEIEKIIRKGYGKRCKEYQPWCVVCETYRALDTLDIAINDKEIHERK